MSWLPNNNSIPKSVEFYIPLSVDVSVEYELNTPPPPPGSAPLLIIHPSAYFGFNAHNRRHSSPQVKRPFSNFTYDHQQAATESVNARNDRFQTNAGSRERTEFGLRQLKDIFKVSNNSRSENFSHHSSADWMLSNAANEAIEEESLKAGNNYLHILSKSHRKPGNGHCSNACKPRTPAKERPQHKQFGHRQDSWKRISSCDTLSGNWTPESLERLKIAAKEAHVNMEMEHCNNILRNNFLESESTDRNYRTAQHGTTRFRPSAKLNNVHNNLEHEFSPLKDLASTGGMGCSAGTNVPCYGQSNANAIGAFATQDAININSTSARDKCSYQFNQLSLLPQSCLAGFLNCPDLNHCPCMCGTCQRKQLWFSE